MNRRLAKIRSATLNIKDRGILTFWLMVDYEDGLSQWVGGLTLDTWKNDKREGTAYGCEMIRQLLLTLDVDDFSEMKGKMVWVHGTGEDFTFRPTGISPLYVDKGSDAKPLIFSDVAAEFL